MDTKSKSISGLIQCKKGERIFFSNSLKHQIIEDYLSLNCSKQEIWKKYTGRNAEHGHILRWMREFGYCSSELQKDKLSSSFAMKNKKKNINELDSLEFENAQLKKRIVELENRLKSEEMRAIAFSTMIDIAEKELDIPIKKKFNIKPSKR